MKEKKRIDKVKNVSIPKFRKLNDISIDIGNRITFISGHNGVGKSTILGLVANASEYTSKEYKSFFGKNFNSKFNEIFNLDLEKDYQKDYSAILRYNYKNDAVYRKCTISRHKKNKKFIENNPKSPEYHLKVVPRNYNFESQILDSNIVHGIGANAKIPIPTLYIGMSRILPNGELDASILNISSKSTDEKYVNYYYSLYFKIFKSINTDLSETKEFQEQDVKFSQKRSLVPTFKEYSAKSMSLGQDSISTILTAITSFKKLKDDLKDGYHGGILLIDEVDAGLHPYAQLQLFKVMDDASRELNLQFMCTTHSLTMIKEILKKVDYTKRNDKDTNIYYSIVYLQNLRSPKLMKDPTYKKIKDDMFLQNKPFITPHEIVNVYLEDAEAQYILDEIIQYDHTHILSDETFKFNLVASSIPCDTLLKLPSKDSYFKSLIICPDGDVLRKELYRTIIDTHENIIPLPTTDCPEDIIFNYIKDTLLKNEEHDYWKMNEDEITSQYIEVKVCLNLQDELKDISKDDKIREIKKNWFKRHIDLFKNSKIMYFWINDNLEDTRSFLNLLNSRTMNLLKDSGQI